MTVTITKDDQGNLLEHAETVDIDESQITQLNFIEYDVIEVTWEEAYMLDDGRWIGNDDTDGWVMIGIV